MSKILFHTLVSLLLFSSLSAQSIYQKQDSIEVRANGSLLTCPWAGGLNEPQFSVIDLNGDGIKDLFIFDRSGNKIRTFINHGTPNKVDYTSAPVYETMFPKGLHDFVLLADYNNDGREDLFTYTIGGMAVYRNDYSSSGGLKFTLVKPLLFSKYNTVTTNLYVSPVNLPSLIDIDNDGDMDVLTFDLSGTYVEFHRNFSQERFSSADSLVYEWDGGCWGDFNGASTSNDVTLHAGCKAQKVKDPHRVSHNAHSGSTLLAFDPDNDGDKDLLVGCVCANSLLYLQNGGNTADAIMISQNDSFPVGPNPTRINTFPAAFYIDVDNDGLKDLIAAPNAPNVSDNYKGAWFYKNTGSASNAIFTLQEKGFLQNQMIETGEGNLPVFFDADADGLKDLIIGNESYFAGTGTPVSKLSYFRNTGTLTKPKFDLITSDYANTSSLQLRALSPTFGDLDGDGDQDMILGESNGLLIYYQNTAGAGQAANFSLVSSNYQSIDVGQYSTPQLVDVDRDGVLDLLVGERSGNINYLHNAGTASSPNFLTGSSSFGNVDTRKAGYVTGYSVPFLFDTPGTGYKLMVGTERGTIFLYDNIEGNLSGTFNKADTTFGNIFEGERSSISLTDIDKDGKLNLAIGNYAGGTGIYSLSTIIAGIASVEKETKPVLYPNPAKNELNITFFTKHSGTISLYSMLGNKVFEAYSEGNSLKINVSNLPNGIYICKLESSKEVFNQKIVISH